MVRKVALHFFKVIMVTDICIDLTQLCIEFIFAFTAQIVLDVFTDNHRRQRIAIRVFKQGDTKKSERIEPRAIRRKRPFIFIAVCFGLVGSFNLKLDLARIAPLARATN